MDHDHLVPLTEDMWALLANLPPFSAGPASLQHHIRRATRQRLEQSEGALRPDDGPLPHWVVHDLRRTMRTNLSAIPQMSDRVREVMIEHNGGMHTLYD
ncbi:hypothetical protein QUS72_22650, partial [Xanthomonas citri pv. citri]